MYKKVKLYTIKVEEVLLARDISTLNVYDISKDSQFTDLDGSPSFINKEIKIPILSFLKAKDRLDPFKAIPTITDNIEVEYIAIHPDISEKLGLTYTEHKISSLKRYEEHLQKTIKEKNRYIEDLTKKVKYLEKDNETRIQASIEQDIKFKNTLCEKVKDFFKKCLE